MEIDLTKYDFLKVFDKKEAEELFYSYSNEPSKGYDYNYRSFYNDCNKNQQKKLDKIKACPNKATYKFKIIGAETRIYTLRARDIKHVINILELEHPKFKLKDVTSIINIDDEININPFKELEEYTTSQIIYSEEECNRLENEILKKIDIWKKWNHIYPLQETKKYKKIHNQLLQMKARLIQRRK